MVDLCKRLEAATLSLTGTGSIKDRLIDAYAGHLADLGADDMPPDVQVEFDDMVHALHRADALPGDDVIKASVRKLSNDDARRYATLVVRLYGMLAGARQQLGNPRGARALAPLARLLAVENHPAAVNS